MKPSLPQKSQICQLGPVSHSLDVSQEEESLENNESEGSQTTTHFNLSQEEAKPAVIHSQEINESGESQTGSLQYESEGSQANSLLHSITTPTPLHHHSGVNFEKK